MRRLNLIGFALLILLFGGIGGWASTAKIAGAVIAPGDVTVQSDVKKVQHLTGGTIKQIFAEDGDLVHAGQVLIRLDDTVTKANLAIVLAQLDHWRMRQARLDAERDSAEKVTFPKSLIGRSNDGHLADAMKSEEKLFESRRDARLGQISQLHERIAQVNEEIKGLTAQLTANKSEVQLTQEELTGVTKLYKQNLVSVMRFMQLKRDMASMEGSQGQLIANIARARAKISETKMQILQLNQDFNSRVLKDLRDAEGKIAELEERAVAAEDQLRHIDIRAPQTGYVTDLSVHTVGGVVSSGETIMKIVPVGDSLVVEAKVNPRDIDRVSLGSVAMARIMVGNIRATPEVRGVVTYISADQTHDPHGNRPYFLVRAKLPQQQMARLGKLKLLPGMPVELFIQTGSRTPLQYLLKPLRDQIARTFKER
jgi:HlyD family secretion protein